MADVQRVQDLLDQLRKPTKDKDDPLKQLFWRELEYDRVNQPLSRHNWSEPARSALAGDPVLFAKGGEDFQVIYARMRSGTLLKTEERPVVYRLLHDHPYALFVFSNQQQDRWHFLNVKYDDDVQRRRLFRRISVSPEDRLRTASERISKIGLRDLPDAAPIAIQTRHDEAFDVEPVTKEFFQEYRRVFEQVEKSIRGISNEERKRLFTQRLFNRIMFIAFVQKKGWLKFKGDTDYLHALWRDHQRDAIQGKNFYTDRLKLLFFAGLNGGASETDVANINRGGHLRNVYGEVPYLNGGLFEEDEDDRNRSIVVPDSAIALIVEERNGLFSRFNFTVNESTPLDVEVAVDPEMLGKIFEELVTGRHESGSYYTPKPIVSFMCREALKGYLETAVRGGQTSKSAIEAFVDEHQPHDLQDAEAVLEALRKIKVCDPACGSGAYLLGMLHELFDLRECLFATKKLDSRSAHDRKLEIIQNNVYGVDIDPFAVNIARLRLWLSLVVEYVGEKPPPLPNLDYKIETGDSVCSLSPAGFQLGLRKSLVDDFLTAKSEYMSAHHAHKLELRKKIRELRASISSWAHRSEAGFDWPIDFAEVFLNDGFDVTLANPPYVRMELIKNLKPALRRNYPEVHAERADLYCYFYARSIELLRAGGMLIFISSNKWLKSAYGSKLRRYLVENASILSITDFGDLSVFSANSYPMILVAAKGRNNWPVRVTTIRTLDPPYPDLSQITRSQGRELNPTSLSKDEWKLEEAPLASGRKLSEYVRTGVCRGIVSGLSEAFVLSDATKRELIRTNRRCGSFIKPFLLGKDIRRWSTAESLRWLLYTPHGCDLREAPEILDYLEKFKTQLKARATKQRWYELQQPQERFVRIFENPKIIFPDIAKEPRFTLDKSGYYFSNTAYAIPSDDLFLLGVLNSSTVETIYRTMSAQIRGGYLRFFAQYVEKIPIPTTERADRQGIAGLVEQCLTKSGVACQAVEEEIDRRVARLFGLNEGSSPKARSRTAQ